MLGPGWVEKVEDAIGGGSGGVVVIEKTIHSTPGVGKSKSVIQTPTWSFENQI